jgi:hypothetical protein
MKTRWKNFKRKFQEHRRHRSVSAPALPSPTLNNYRGSREIACCVLLLFGLALSACAINTISVNEPLLLVPPANVVPSMSCSNLPAGISVSIRPAQVSIPFSVTNKTPYGFAFVAVAPGYSSAIGHVAPYSTNLIWTADSLTVGVKYDLQFIQDVSDPILIASNLALHRPATSSSIESPAGANCCDPALAVDGNPSTRAATAISAAPQWFAIDLGTNAALNRVRIPWESAYPTAFQVQTSLGGIIWADAALVTNNSAGLPPVNDISITATGRYVRIWCTQRATAYGYSPYEIEIYGWPLP